MEKLLKLLKNYEEIQRKYSHLFSVSTSTQTEIHIQINETQTESEDMDIVTGNFTNVLCIKSFDRLHYSTK